MAMKKDEKKKPPFPFGKKKKSIASR